MSIQVIHSEYAPKVVGPYSQAIVNADVLYASGQIGLDAKLGTMVGDGVEEQAEQVTKNLTAVLQAAESNIDDILKVNIFLVDMDDFPLVNTIYAAWLGEHRPARATVAVAALPVGATVEMDLIARIP